MCTVEKAGPEGELFARAERGRLFWLARSLDDYDLVLLLVPMRTELTAELLAALEAIMRKAAGQDRAGAATRALVLSCRSIPASGWYAAENISEEETADLLSLYCLYEFSDKLVVGSLDLPFGRKARHLLGVSGVESEAGLLRTLLFANGGA